MELKKYPINIIEMWCTYTLDSASKGRVNVIEDDISFTVENYVRKHYEELGYLVLEGSHVHFFLWFCCGKFDNQRGGNYGGSEWIKLNKENAGFCRNKKIAKKYNTMVKNASKMWLAYYHDYPPKKDIKLLDLIRCLNSKELIGLLKSYSAKPYKSKGAPDLVVFNPQTREKQFVEVKSYRDSLRFEQLMIASDIINCVGNLFTIAYVLPLNMDDLEVESLFKLAMDDDAKYLKKLYLMDINKIWRGFNKTDDKVCYAEYDCKVTINCLYFFLSKTKNVIPKYTTKHFYATWNREHKRRYLNRLELEWAKLNKSKN